MFVTYGLGSLMAVIEVMGLVFILVPIENALYMDVATRAFAVLTLGVIMIALLMAFLLPLNRALVLSLDADGRKPDGGE